MILLDAYALIALLVEEPAAEEVAELIRDTSAGMSTVNLAESVDHCIRVQGIPDSEVRAAIWTLLHRGNLTAIAADAVLATRAGAIRAEHYRPRTSELSLADCFLLASATPGEDAIATADPPVAEAARALSIELHALPDSKGRRP